jgi:hypothetical protein
MISRSIHKYSRPDSGQVRVPVGQPRRERSVFVDLDDASVFVRVQNQVNLDFLIQDRLASQKSISLNCHRPAVHMPCPPIFWRTHPRSPPSQCLFSLKPSDSLHPRCHGDIAAQEALTSMARTRRTGKPQSVTSGSIAVARLLLQRGIHVPSKNSSIRRRNLWMKGLAVSHVNQFTEHEER